MDIMPTYVVCAGISMDMYLYICMGMCLYIYGVCICMDSARWKCTASSSS